ncbi:uncharacterized protein [Magallana gigas]|uniref:uncharacterized protein n=1 Tax=Magallana gigas TaxID=29159 RepID=UPI0005C3CAB4|eukprot:XP_011456845.1 PREDICTED: uncharacterized protein LOC105348933 [Crassostrea gigas]
MRFIRVLSLLCGLSCLGVGLANEQQCLAMHTFQTTYNDIRNKADEMAALVQKLKAQLDTTIEQNCGDVGLNAASNLYSFNLTHCDFEDGSLMCGFTQNRDDTYDWQIDNTYPDHTLGSKMGHSLRNYRPGSYIMRVTSRPFNPAHAYCIRFFYKAETRQNTAGKLNVYLQEGNLRGNPVFSVTNIPAHDWTLAEITPDPEYLRRPFQIVFEADHLNQYVYVDDLSVYNAPCSTEGIRVPRCPPGSVENNIGGQITCYVFHMEPKTYIDAMKACKAIWPQASLVAIETAAEQAFISNMINTSHAMSLAADFGLWTNGNDFDHENSFTWSGQAHPVPLNYTHWHPGQPNNIAGVQDCLVIEYPKYDYEWGDVSCSEKHSFICEMNFDPKVQTLASQNIGTIIG